MPTLGHGTTITFDTGFFATITNIQWTGIERASVPNTHFGTTGGQSFEPADLVNPGELVVEIQHVTTEVPPLNSAAETITITWPDTETHSASGFMIGYEINATDEELVTATARLKLTGAITW